MSFILRAIALNCFVCLFFFFPAPFFCSESVDELKSGSCEFPQSSIEQKERGYEDEEQRISEYLTLLQLGLILRELAIKGMMRGAWNYRAGSQGLKSRTLVVLKIIKLL